MNRLEPRLDVEFEVDRYQRRDRLGAGFQNVSAGRAPLPRSTNQTCQVYGLRPSPLHPGGS
jgi:hypothetical protein